MLIAIVVAVAVVSGSDSDDRDAVAADPACIEAWNEDASARAYGRHNFSFHLYQGALVTFLDAAGEEVGSRADGFCAVVFPSKVLDSEPFAAGQVLRGKRWLAISDLEDVPLTRVAELQVLAAGSPNTTLDVQGVLAALP